jgi:subtilisin family serine protease
MTAACLAGVALALGVLGLVAPPAAAQTPDPADEVIVVFRPGLDARARERVLRQAGGGARKHFKRVNASAATLHAHGRAALAGHPDVRAVSPDRPLRKLGKKAGAGTDTIPQVVPPGVTRVAPGPLPVTGAGIGVAIVDTGIDFAHPDLKVAVACFSAYRHCQDDEGHGTHVSGIVAALDNHIDVVGVAPGATLYAVKVLNKKGSGTDSTVIEGLEWVADNAATLSPPIRIVNMSLGREGTIDDSPALREAVQALHAAGIVVVVAAGNDEYLEVSQQVPATYPEVFAVASTTAATGEAICRVKPIKRDTASWWSSDGAFDRSTRIGVTISAPGEEREDVDRNCYIVTVGLQSLRRGGGTTRMAGTSMSAPHVVGVIALLLEQTPTLTPEEVRARIRRDADGDGRAPRPAPISDYSFDGEREGVAYAPGALGLIR